MFSTQDFQDWGKQHAVLFVSVMTKIEGRKDDELLRTYEFTGFPSMAILDAEGTAIHKRIPRDLPSMQAIVAAAPSYMKLAAAIEAGHEVDLGAWFLAQLGMGRLDAATARAQLASVELPADARATAEQTVFALEMGELMGKARARGVTAEDRLEIRNAVYEAFLAGGRLPAGAAPEAFVDEMLVEAAREKGDAKAFFFAYDRVRAGQVARIEQVRGLLPKYRSDLETYKDDAKMLERVQASLQRAESAITATEQQVAELDAAAKKLR